MNPRPYTIHKYIGTMLSLYWPTKLCGFKNVLLHSEMHIIKKFPKNEGNWKIPANTIPNNKYVSQKC